MDFPTDTIKKYVQSLEKKSIAKNELKRRLLSVDKFLRWAHEKGYLTSVVFKQMESEIASKTGVGVKSEESKKPSARQSFTFESLGIRHYIGFALVLLLISMIGAGLYNQFFRKTATPFAYSSSPLPGTRLISFQGRLTDSIGNPITAPIDITYNFYQNPTGGTPIATSTRVCTAHPDQDGIFSNMIGNDEGPNCSSQLPSSIFTDNATVYLGVTIGSELTEMSPRQQIANVGYAMNAEALQGMPPGTTASSIPFISAAGDMLIAAANPGIRSTYASSNFVISSANATTIQSANGGDIVLSATDGGTLRFNTYNGTLNERMTITPLGNVGISNANPRASLDVIGDASLSGNLAFNGATTQLTQLNGGNMTFATSPGGDVGAAARMTLSSLGNLGIGTTVPGYRLDVAGSASVSGNLSMGGQLQIGRFAANPAAVGTGSIYFNTTDSTLYVYNSTTWVPVGTGTGTGGSFWDRVLDGVLISKVPADALNLGNQATASATVHLAGAAGDNSFINTGNFGIGTNNPTQKLEVAGNIYSSTGLGIGEVNSGDMFHIKKQDVFNAVYVNSNGAWSNNTTEAASSYGTAFTLQQHHQSYPTTDYGYVGKSTTYSTIYIDISTASSAVTYAYEYSKGSGVWGVLTLTTDGTNDGSGSMRKDGTIVFTPPGDWATDTVNGTTGYWVRWYSTVNPSTHPTAYLVVPSDQEAMRIYANDTDAASTLRVSRNGNVSIGTDTSDSYRLYVSGNGYFSSALSTGSTLSTSSYITQSRNSLGMISNDGISLNNTTAATAVAPVQIAPRLRMSGTVWDAAASASRTVNWKEEVQAISGATGKSRMDWAYGYNSVTDTGFDNLMSLTSDGELNVFGTTFGSETLTNGNLTAGASWSSANGVTLSSDRANYAHNALGGTLTQTSASLATAAQPNRWYKLTYTTSSVVAGVNAYVGTEFADQKTYLPGIPATAGTYDVIFKSNAAPGDFVIHFESTAGSVILDTLSLVEIQSGNIVANGLLTGGGTSGIKILSDGNVGIGSTSPSSFKLEVAGDIGPDADNTRNIGSATRFYNTIYANNIVGVSALSYWVRNTGILSPGMPNDGIAATSSATTVATFTSTGTNNAAQIGGTSNYLTVASNGSLTFTNSSAATITGPAAGLTIDAGTGTMGFGTSNNARTINMGTGTGVDTINIGTGATGADVIAIGSANAGNVTVQSNAVLSLTGSTNSLIDFPNFDVATTGNVTVAAGQGIDTNAAGILNVGNTTATTVNVGNTAAATIAIGAGGSLTRTFNIGTGTGVDTINLGTGGTGADVINIGSANAGNVTMRSNATLTLAGSTNSIIDFPNFDVATTGNVTVAAGQGIDTNAAGIMNVGNTTATTVNVGNTAATTIAIGAGGSLTRTFNIGTGTGVDTINIGTGATGADVIAIGSANAGNVSVRSNATLTLAGSTNSIIDFPNFDVATTGQITSVYANAAALNLTGNASGITFGGAAGNANSINTSNNNHLLLVPGTGNVGISSATPTSFKLEVGGDIGPDADNTRNIGSASRYYNTIYANNIVGVAALGYWQRVSGILSPFTTSDGLAATTSATTVATFTSGGTNDSLRAGGGSNYLTVASNGSLTFTNSSTATITGPASGLTIDAGIGTLGLGTSNNTKTINIGTGTGTDTIHIGDGATGADVITIGSANAGNVSVRSNATLTLAGSTNSIIDFPNFDVATTGQITSVYANAAALNLTGNGSGITFGGAASNANSINTSNNNHLNISTGTGNVGIGSSTPREKLDVAGSATISGNLTIAQGSAIRSAYGPLTFSYKSGLNAWQTGMTIDDITGYVGIGTNSPASPLTLTKNWTDIASTSMTENITSSVNYTTNNSNQFRSLANYAYIGAATGTAVSGTQATYHGALYIDNTNAGTISNAYANYFYSGIDAGAAGTVNNMNVYNAGMFTAGANTTTFDTWRGYNVDAISAATLNGATVTTLVGYDVGAISGGTTNIAYRGQVASGANRYNLYMNGTASNYLEGNVGIGSSNPSSFKLEVAGNIGPDADNTRDIGSTTRHYNTIYANNIVGVDALGYWNKVAGILSPYTMNDGLAATSSATTVATFTSTGTNSSLRAGGAANYLTVASNGNLSFTNSSTATITGPTAGLTIDATTGTLGFGTSNNNRTVNIGTGTGVDTINIGTGATGADVIAIGSANAGNVTVRSNATLTLAGSTNSVIDFPNFDVATTGQITSVYANAAALSLTGNGSGITFGGAAANTNTINTSNNNHLNISTGTGNVGIGTATPREKLDVAGSATISGNLTIAQGSALRSSYGPLSLAYKSSLTGWTTGLTLQDGSGNTGIGTTLPKTRLEVSQLGNPILRLTNSNTGISTGDEYGRLEFFTADSSVYGNDVMARIRAVTENVNTDYGNLSFQVRKTGDAGSNPTWQDSLYLKNDGNVGVGTTTPTSFKLEVAGNIGPDADNTRDIGSSARHYNTIYANNLVGIDAIGYWNKVSGILSPFTLNDGIAATSSATTVATFTSTGTNNSLRAGGSANYLAVASNGNLSFTNSSAATITGPTAGLTIDATTGTLGFGTSNNNRTINIGTGTGIDTINVGTGATGADVINIGSANAGNVTVRSNAALSLTGSTNSVIDFPNFDVATTGQTTIAYANAAALNLSGNAAGITFSGAAANTNSINTSNNNHLNIVTGTGNVGIGSATPGYKLDVNGSFRVNTAMAIDASGYSTTPAANSPWQVFRNSNSQNIIPNGDMESWTAGTSTYPDGFTNYSSPVTVTRESTAANIHQGSYSAKIVSPTTGAVFPGLAYKGTRIDKNPGDSSTASYTLSFWYKASSTNVSTSSIGVYDTAAATYVYSANLVKDDAWHYISSTFNIRYDSDWYIRWSTGAGAATAGDTLYLDEISLTKGNEVYASAQAPVSATGNVTRWGNFYNVGGNVGIGTTTASSFALEVAGNMGPDGNNTRDLGSSSRYFNTIYVNNIVGTGALGYWARTAGILSPVTANDGIAATSSATTVATFTSTGTNNSVRAGGAANYLTVASNGNLTFANSGTASITGPATGLTIDAGTGTMGFGTSNNARTINMGTGTGVDTINIGTGATGADVITIGSANAGNVSVRSNAVLSLTGSTNSLIDFPNFDVATTGNVTVAAGQGIDTNAAGILNVGNTTATTVNVGNTAATTIALGAGGSLTRTFNIGTGTGVDTINIGTGATGADVIAIGSANAGNVTVRSNATLTLAGSTNSIIDFPNFDVATTGQITSVYANAAALNLTGNASGITFGGAAGNMNTINTSNNNNLNIEPGSGNVGISSTTPTSFKLEVAGDIGPDADGTRSLGSPSRHYNNLYVNNIFGSGSLGYWTRNAGVLSPSTGNDAVAATSSATTVATFTSSGTNTSLRAGGSANYLAVASNGSLTFTNSSTATITGPTAGLTIDATTGTLGFGTSNNNRTVNIGTGTGIDTIHIGDGATGADIITIGSANAGNVTVRSNAALSLIGSTNSIIDYPAFDVATTGQTTIAYANAAALNLSGNGAGITFSGAAANTNTINTSNNNHLNLLTGTGNVGIGSATPGTKLDVVGAIRTNNQLISTIATGTAPLSVASTTMVSNLNSDMVDGFHGTDLAKRAGYSATLTAPAGWYRIASNGPVTVGGSGGSRAVAMFTVRDTTSGRHSNTTFYASVNYGNNPTLTMLNRSFYTSNGCIKKARLIEGSTYEGAAVEIYVENGGLDCSVSYTMYDNEQSSGWTAENWTAGSLPVGFTETDMNFDTTNPILAASSNGNADAFYVGRTGNMHLSGALDIAGSIANAAGNVVIADTADIGSATTGLRIDATGLIADIDGNIRMNDILEVNTIRDYSGGNITLQDDAGNVGIGSTSPSEKLDVTGDVYIAGSGTSIGRATLANGSLKIGSTLAIDSNELYYGVNSYIGTIGAFSLSLDTNATTRIALDATGNINFNNGQMYLAQSSGNLGLGTTVPGYRLDVQGWASASGNLTTGGQFQLGRFASAPAPTLGSGSMYFNSTDNSVYYYDGTIWNQIAAGGTSFWTRDSGVLSPLNEGDVIAATSGAHTVATFTQLDPTKLALRAGGSTDATTLNVFGNGNVGIGTINQYGKLTVAGGIAGPKDSTTAFIDSARNVTPWDQTFEENITGWAQINSTSFTRDLTQAWDGAYSLKIKRNDLTGSGGVAYAIGPEMKAGRVYTLSGYYKMVNGAGTAGIKLNSNGMTAYTNGTTYTDKTLPNAANWTFFSISVTASTVTVGNNNYVWIGHSMPDATQEIYFDNLVLSEGSLPTTEYANMKTSVNGLATYFGGNVGIGTSVPLEKLDIAGNATISGNLTMGYGSTIRPAYGSLNFDYKSGLNAWATGMVMQSSNGNVGIGTTAPIQKLQIAGNMAFDAVDRHIYRGTSARLSLLSSSTVFNESSGNIDLRVEGDTDQYLLFADASVDRIGIGTSTPGSKFDVRSTQTSGTLGSFGAPSAVTLAGALTGVNIDMSTNYTATNQSVTGQTIAMPTVVNTLGGTFTYKALSIAGGGITHNTTIGTDNWSGVDIVMPNLTQTVGAITSTGLKITGGTVTSGTSYGLTIDDAAGNVGIGTTAPTSKLQIASTLPLTGSANGLYLGVTDTETGALGSVARGALQTSYTKNGAGSIGSWMSYAANFNGAITAGSTTSHWGVWSRQTVDGTGSIGTLSDFVADSQYGTAGSVTTRYGLDVKDFNKGGSQTLGTQYGVYVESLTSGSTNYAFYSAGTAPSSFGGNVGIGTTTPLDALDVRGGATLAGSLTVGSNSLIKPAYGPLSFAYKSGLDTWTTGITLQDTTGSVGIGTTSPLALLHVQGARGGNAAMILNQLSGGPIFTASSSGTPRFTIANNGNVGIGVGYANPANPLQVLSTSAPQLRLSYSTSEYATMGVSSNGTTTLTSPNGASNKLSFVSGLNSGGLTNEAITLKSNQTLNSDDEILQVLGNTTPYFSVMGGGLVWIGNTNPSTSGLTANDKLYIDGDFRAAKFLSNTNSNRYVDPANGSRMSTIEITDGSSLQFNDASNVGIGTIKMEGSSVRIGNNVADGISDVDLCVGSDSSCAGKVDAGTVDPPYTINGKKYATYMASMTGVKEETTGVLSPEQAQKTGDAYAYVIDFDNQAEASDLWLFAKATNVKDRMSRLNVLLTPSENTRTWYKTDADHHALIVYSSRPSSISYRLTAPRFDDTIFSNTRPDDAAGGFVINDPDIMTSPYTLTDSGSILEAMNIETPASQDSSPDMLRSLSYSLRNIQTGSLIEETAVYANAMFARIQTGFAESANLLVTNIANIKTAVITNLTATTARIDDALISRLYVQEKIVSPVIETEKIKTDTIAPAGTNLTLDLSAHIATSSGDFAKLVIKGINDNTVVSIDAQGNATFAGSLAAKEASISGSLTASEATISGTLIAKEIHADNIDELANTNLQLSSNLASQSSSLAQLNSSSQQLSSDVNSVQQELAALKNQPLPNAQYYQTLSDSAAATVSALLAQSVSTDSLMVTGTANLFKASVADSLTAGNILIQDNAILSLASDLRLSALAQVTFFDGTVMIAKNGTITSKGEVIAEGGIKTNTIQAVTEDANIAVNLNADKKLQVTSEGQEVASIDASGSAKFNSLAFNEIATNSAFIADSGERTSANEIIPAIQTNAEAAGTGVLPSNAPEIIIYNSKVTNDSLIYLTPTGETHGAQLTVVKKESCNSAQPLTPCTPYFSVSTGTGLHAEIKFNWLIIN